MSLKQALQTFWGAAADPLETVCGDQLIIVQPSDRRPALSIRTIFVAKEEPDANYQ